MKEIEKEAREYALSKDFRSSLRTQQVMLAYIAGRTKSEAIQVNHIKIIDGLQKYIYNLESKQKSLRNSTIDECDRALSNCDSDLTFNPEKERLKKVLNALKTPEAN